MEFEDKQAGGEPTPEGEVAPHNPEPDEGAGQIESDPTPAAVMPVSLGGSPPAPPAPAPVAAADDDGDEEEDGMLRMSFLEHLEELRTRLIQALIGVAVSFALSLIFANQIWQIISQPAIEALSTTGANPNLVFIKPTEAFSIIWVKAPMLVALFLAAPWILYQVWAFIAPGLYKKERKWAAPFVISTAGLFILGGLFAYFVAFRFGLAFLLSIGRDIHVMPMITATEYFDLFVNATIGVGLVFEMPVLLFLLTLLRIVSPRFLLRNTRYAILIIVIIAAIVTPTPDIFNLMLFAIPMCALFFVGVFASYLLVLHRERRRFPWAKVLYGVLVFMVAIAGMIYLAITKYGYHYVPHWPFLVR